MAPRKFRRVYQAPKHILDPLRAISRRLFRPVGDEVRKLRLLKIEWVDREIAWLPGLLFIVFAWPARMLCGWAVAAARKRPQPVHWLWRWSSRLLAIPVVLTYLLVTYLSLYVSWQGAYALLEQHAFLLPVPFFSG